jgi:hypothetical protein
MDASRPLQSTGVLLRWLCFRSLCVWSHRVAVFAVRSLTDALTALANQLQATLQSIQVVREAITRR